MPLSSFTGALQLAWNLNGSSVCTFPGPSESSNVQWAGQPSTSTWNQLYATCLTISASSTDSIVLTGLTNLINESFSFGHVLAIGITVSGENIKFGPGASNPLQWFFSSTTATVEVNAGGTFLWFDNPSGTGTAVTSTAKQLDFTNLSSSASATVTVVILGSTS